MPLENIKTLEKGWGGTAEVPRKNIKRLEGGWGGEALMHGTTTTTATTRAEEVPLKKLKGSRRVGGERSGGGAI